jgi:hypothetical protein
MSLSLWVPLPTPGAPTNMILAAFLSFFVVVLKVILAPRVGRDSCERRDAGEGASDVGLPRRQIMVKVSGPHHESYLAGVSAAGWKSMGSEFVTRR